MIRILTNADSDFYSLIGPFLSRREIVKELGHPVWDEDGKVWFVWIDDNVRGFCSLLENRKKVVFGSDYVLPEFRRQGIYNQLFQARMDYLKPGKSIETVATAASLNTFLRYGFSVQKQRGRYYVLQRQT